LVLEHWQTTIPEEEDLIGEIRTRLEEALK